MLLTPLFNSGVQDDSGWSSARPLLDVCFRQRCDGSTSAEQTTLSDMVMNRNLMDFNGFKLDLMDLNEI